MIRLQVRFYWVFFFTGMYEATFYFYYFELVFDIKALDGTLGTFF